MPRRLTHAPALECSRARQCKGVNPWRSEVGAHGAEAAVRRRATFDAAGLQCRDARSVDASRPWRDNFGIGRWVYVVEVLRPFKFKDW